MINKRYVTEIGYLSVNHVGEELCGDNVVFVEPDEDTKILVLADGLGSGVKANILSTLTAKMLSTMMANNMSIEECVTTMAETLPICQVRNVAYSTFSIIKVKENKHVDIYNFDNPMPFIIRDGQALDLDYTCKVIEGKKIYHAQLEAELNDYNRLLDTGINLPKLLEVDYKNERILKEYIEGPTIYDLVKDVAPEIAYVPSSLFMNALMSSSVYNPMSSEM